MIMTAAEYMLFVPCCDVGVQVLEAELSALEMRIRAYTNNNFQNRAFRAVGDITAEKVIHISSAVPFKVGDTLQISNSALQSDCLVTVVSVENGDITVKESMYGEYGIVITKVEYPDDVKLGVVSLLKWGIENRDKVGVASETISRHSVTYFNMDNDNTIMGYPRSLMGFLRPYMRARFGKGLKA